MTASELAPTAVTGAGRCTIQPASKLAGGALLDQTCQRLTRVHSETGDRHTATTCVPIEAVLAYEVDSTEGTPEWRAWVARAAERYDLTDRKCDVGFDVWDF